MKKNKLALIASVMYFAGAQSAAANEPGFYLGGYFGQASKQPARTIYIDLTEALQEFAAFRPVDERVSFDDTGTALALFVGYRLNRYLAFEGAYTKLGKVAYTSRATGDYPQEPGSLTTVVETETSGFLVSALGTLPLTRNWEVFLRGGALFAHNGFRFDLRAQGENFVPPTGNRLSGSLSKGTTETFAGIGISRRILEVYDLRLEYQRAFDAGLRLTGGKADLDAALLGVTVTF